MDLVKGMRVCVVDSDGHPNRIKSVAKVGKLKTTLEDGSEWQTRWPNHRYGPSDRFYRGPSLREVRDGDAKQILLTRLVTWAARARWGVVSVEALEKVYEIVHPEIVAWEAEHLKGDEG